MTNIKDVMRIRPVVTYFVLTFAISWGGIFMVMGPGGILGTREVSNGLMPFVYLATLLGPSVSGLLIPPEISGMKVVTYNLLFSSLLWVFVAALALVSRSRHTAEVRVAR